MSINEIRSDKVKMNEIKLDPKSTFDFDRYRQM